MFAGVVRVLPHGGGARTCHYRSYQSRTKGSGRKRF